MSISKIYESGIQQNNTAHFANIIQMAFIDGEMNEGEKNLAAKFAQKLNIIQEEYRQILKDPKKYPLIPVTSKEERLQHLFDLFKMIFADHSIDQQEIRLIHNYAIGLGCSKERALKLIKESIRIFQGKLDFEEYRYLVERG